ncbi:cytochrome o ubiquinol oxidase subunit IV [Povalibacter sp.]|uniref:cytochrome o ubiquinol oxidase subunit IV n=1 Tax=Povalibacter sp. TaxID=1962978 RepID=UPI002F410939
MIPSPDPDSIDAQGHAPGASSHGSWKTYVNGLLLALLLTGGSFWAASSDAIYAPGVPILLAVLAIAQMGVHIVFFLNISSAPDQTNNVLALAFGVMVVGLIVFGSLLIMANLSPHTMSMHELEMMQR